MDKKILAVPNQVAKIANNFSCHYFVFFLICDFLICSRVIFVHGVFWTLTIITSLLSWYLQSLQCWVNYMNSWYIVSHWWLYYQRNNNKAPLLCLDWLHNYIHVFKMFTFLWRNNSNSRITELVEEMIVIPENWISTKWTFGTRVLNAIWSQC